MATPNIEKLEILNKAVRFCVWLYQKVGKFDRRYKFTLGDRIVLYGELAVENLLKANAETDRGKAAERIYEALTDMDMLSIKTRIACALGVMSAKEKADCDIDIAEIKESGRRWRSYFLRLQRNGSNGESGDPQDGSPESRE